MTTDEEDRPAGRAVSRRNVLQGLGVAAVSATAGAVAATWVDDDSGAASREAPLDFVFGSAASSDDGGFARWEDLVDALDSAPLGDKWIAVDGDAVVPQGTWDLHGAGFRGREAAGVGLPPNGHPVVLRFADGARMENASRHLARDGIVLCSDSTGPVVTIDDERSYYFEDDAWVVSTEAPFFEVTATNGTMVLFSFRTGSGLVHASTAGLDGRDRASIDHTGAATLIVALAAGNNIFDDDTVVGNGVVIAAISAAAGIRNPMTPRAGFTHSGSSSVTPLLFSAAENMAVRPRRAEDWPEPPTDVGRALDLLAARVAALEGGSAS